jgi:hypothetical protein
MTTLEKFNRAVIKAIHGLTYKEALKKEKINIGSEVHYIYNDFGDIVSLKIKPYITIGKVMQAIMNKTGSKEAAQRISGLWELIKENGQEADSSDQSEKTLLSILNLIN